MKLLCITPTYGRPIELLQNSLACFYSQTYTNAYQIFLDDTFDGPTIEGDNYAIVQNNERYSNLSIKHNYAVQIGIDIFGEVDGIVVWDDDDIYLPNHLENISKSLKNGESFSFSSKIYSCLDETVKIEDNTAGRFHGNIAFNYDLFTNNKWENTLRMDFDTTMIDKLTKSGTVIDRIDPTYVYRWVSSGEHHCSGVSKGPEDETWYSKTPVIRNKPIQNLEPLYDKNTLLIKDYLKSPQLLNHAS